jgi:hypothetical protein
MFNKKEERGAEIVSTMSKSGSTLGEEERQLPARLEIGKAESKDDGVGIQLD